jgi:hypothetical protein
LGGGLYNQNIPSKVEMTKNNSKSSSNVLFVIFPVIFIIIGLIAFTISLKDINMAKKSSLWFATKGIITNSSVLQQKSTYTTRWLERENFAPEKIKYTFEVYKTDIFYEYNIDGIKYINNLISKGDEVWTGNENEMNEIKNRYPEGSSITVYYNKNNQQESVLEPEIHNKNIWFLFKFGLVFMGIGILLIILWKVIILKT